MVNFCPSVKPFFPILSVWIRIHKAAESVSILDPDPQHCCLDWPIASSRKLSFCGSFNQLMGILYVDLQSDEETSLHEEEESLLMEGERLNRGQGGYLGK